MKFRMAEALRISIDAMGGDQGPAMVVPALDLIVERHPGAQILLYGDQARIQPFLSRLRHASTR